MYIKVPNKNHPVECMMFIKFDFDIFINIVTHMLLFLIINLLIFGITAYMGARGNVFGWGTKVQAGPVHLVLPLRKY
jgi:hypothetical protein